jgi:hypothetical protein
MSVGISANVSGGDAMAVLSVGDRVEAESESVYRSPRRGVIEEVLAAEPTPRYRIRWDDGHESVLTPASGALARVPG